MADALDDRAAALEDEQRRLRELRMVVDLTANVLAQGHLPRHEAEALVESARRRILEMFPDKQSTYDLVLAPRFARLLDEFSGAASDRDRRVLAFRKPG